MNQHEILYKKAKEAIDELFSDLSVSSEEAEFTLRILIEEMEIMIESLGQS